MVRWRSRLDDLSSMEGTIGVSRSSAINRAIVDPFAHCGDRRSLVDPEWATAGL